MKIRCKNDLTHWSILTQITRCSSTGFSAKKRCDTFRISSTITSCDAKRITLRESKEDGPLLLIRRSEILILKCVPLTVSSDTRPNHKINMIRKEHLMVIFTVPSDQLILMTEHITVNLETITQVPLITFPMQNKKFSNDEKKWLKRH